MPGLGLRGRRPPTNRSRWPSAYWAISRPYFSDLLKSRQTAPPLCAVRLNCPGRAPSGAFGPSSHRERRADLPHQRHLENLRAPAAVFWPLLPHRGIGIRRHGPLPHNLRRTPRPIFEHATGRISCWFQKFVADRHLIAGPLGSNHGAANCFYWLGTSGRRSRFGAAKQCCPLRKKDNLACCCPC